MKYTRLDIAYAIGRLSCYTHNPIKEHWHVLFRLLKCLRGTMKWCSHFNKFSTVLEDFCDANWVFNYNEVSSTSSYMFILGR